MNVGEVAALSAPLAVGIAAIGSGVGLGLTVMGAMNAIARQPNASNKILTTMIIGAALIEALTIYALIVFFTLLGKMGTDVGHVAALSAPLSVGIAAIGSGIGLGLTVYGAMNAIARQPSASNKILTTMIIGAALIEALTIYALIVFFTLLGKMG